MIGIFFVLISGALMSIQGVFNTQVTKSTSMWVTNSFVHFTAFAMCLVMWFFGDKKSFTSLMNTEPKYMLFGGVIGAFITFTVIKGMEMLGPAQAVMLIVISQLFVAYMIEIFGLFGMDKQPFEWKRLLGMCICVVGVILFKWK